MPWVGSDRHCPSGHLAAADRVGIREAFLGVHRDSSRNWYALNAATKSLGERPALAIAALRAGMRSAAAVRSAGCPNSNPSICFRPSFSLSSSSIHVLDNNPSLCAVRQRLELLFGHAEIASEHEGAQTADGIPLAHDSRRSCEPSAAVSRYSGDWFRGFGPRAARALLWASPRQASRGSSRKIRLAMDRQDGAITDGGWMGHGGLSSVVGRGEAAVPMSGWPLLADMDNARFRPLNPQAGYFRR